MAERYGTEMVPVGKHRIDLDRIVKITLRSPDVSKIVLGDAPVKIDPTVGGVEPGQDVELADGIRITAFREGVTPPEHENILVILGTADRAE